MVYPYLSYCCNVWGGCYDIHMKPLFTLQKRIIRIMNNESFHAHTGPLFLIDKILKVKDIYRFSLGVYMYRNRGSIDFNRQHGYFSVYFAAPSSWNSIPDHIRNSATLPIFKRRYKSFLCDSYV